MPNTNVGGVALGDLILGAELTAVISRTVTSTLSLTQSVSHTIEAMVQTITFNQTISYTRAYSRTVTSTLVLTQDIRSLHPDFVTSTLSLSQALSYTKEKHHTVSQSAGFNQTLAGTHIANRLIFSGLTLTHTRDYDAVFARPNSDALTFVQTIHADKCTTANNTLNLTQTVAYTKDKKILHTLEWQQGFIYPTTFNRSINSVLGLSQQIAPTARHNTTVAQTLTFNQTIVQARVLGISQSLGLSQSIVAYASRGVSNPLALTQAIHVQMVYNRKLSQPLVFDPTISTNRTFAKEIHHGFGMNSFVRRSKVNIQTLTSTFTPTQQVRFNVYNRTISQTLSLSQTVSYTPVKPLTVTNSLQFTQTVGLKKVLARSVESVLAFLPVRQVYVGIGGIDYYTIENVQYSLVPSYLVGKKNRPMCVLQVNNAAITLPAPEFGDAEAYGGVFVIRRSMNNIPYTHVRTLSLRKLNLPFVLAKRKAWELREFLIEHNAELMTLTTWKGDKWFVNLTTNPLELRVSGKYSAEDEKVSVELEFEGLKVM